MKLGILREEKVLADKRVAFSPKQCKEIINNFLNIQLFVQSSNIRCFLDSEYLDMGVPVVDDISDCDILFGIKEVSKNNLFPNKTYFYFSHTIKKQDYNRDLLIKMMDLNIQMIDYEVLKSDNGERLLGFGRYAGIIGAYNTFVTYGLKFKLYSLKPANKCIDRKEMEDEMKKICLKNERFVITGKGRVGLGILEILNLLKITQVSLGDYLNNKYDYPIYVNLDTMDFNQRSDMSEGNFHDFVHNPSSYESRFMKYAEKSDVFIAGHYYGSGSPYLFTRSDVRSPNFNISVVADVSCDIDGPVATTIRSSTISEPIYGYDPLTEKEDDFTKDDIIAVMAVDNLPCELPKDASEDFGNQLIENVIPLIGKDSNILKNATICRDGDLTEEFEYLRDFVTL
jgi:saccharopine dehydrogenase (NAD+, L-lysine-forming)